MKIEFPKVPSDVATSLEGATVVNIISFPVVVDGRRFLNSITFEALIKHFDAVSDAGADVKRAFDSGRERIHAVTEEQLTNNGARSVHLTARDF
jgi:hypothetical protein